jgi:hypothetical protein
MESVGIVMIDGPKTGWAGLRVFIFLIAVAVVICLLAAIVMFTG